MPNSTSIQYKIASTLEECLGALKLVYEAYIRAGLLRPNESGLRGTPHHLNPSTRIFIAKAGDHALYTTSFILHPKTKKFIASADFSPADFDGQLPLEVIRHLPLEVIEHLKKFLDPAWKPMHLPLEA